MGHDTSSRVEGAHARQYRFSRQVAHVPHVGGLWQDFTSFVFLWCQSACPSFCLQLRRVSSPWRFHILYRSNSFSSIISRLNRIVKLLCFTQPFRSETRPCQKGGVMAGPVAHDCGCPGDDDVGETSAVKSKIQPMKPSDQDIATHEARWSLFVSRLVPPLCWAHWAVRRSQTTA